MITLKKTCPNCKTPNSIAIKNNQLVCTQEDCHFSVVYACPLCDTHIEQENFGGSEDNPNFKCGSCSSTVPIKKVANLIEIGQVVDREIRCDICGGPTIHRPDMNLAHRCFFYPNCSGQSDLFGGTKESFTFLDFETTGLEPGKDTIIEIGALKIDEEGYEHIYQTFVNPQFPIPTKIAEFTGITNSMVADAPLIDVAIKELRDFIGQSKIVAHNADFDVPWLITGYIQHELTYPNNDVICTLKWARGCEEPRASLGALTKKYGIGHANAHRALADAAATKELFFIFENAKKADRQEVTLANYEGQVKRSLERLRT